STAIRSKTVLASVSVSICLFAGRTVVAVVLITWVTTRISNARITIEMSISVSVKPRQVRCAAIGYWFFIVVDYWFALRLMAIDVSTDPAGTPVAGSTCAGQVTVIFASDVVSVGGSRYVRVNLKIASDGTVAGVKPPVCAPSFV